MDIRKLQRAIVDGLEDVKAQNIVVFNTEALSPLFERVIIASGTSNRQTKALAASVRDAVKGLGEPVPRMEGEENGEWIIVDCGAAVAHIMQPTIREYYHLEEIWGMKPVNLKAAVKKARSGLPKAEEPLPAAAAPARKRSAKTPAKTAAKTSAKTAAKSAATTPAKSPAKTPVKASPRPASKAPAKAAGTPVRQRATTAGPRTAAKTSGAGSSPARPAPRRVTQKAAGSAPQPARVKARPMKK
ncbi:MAG: ribosome silencing factor [Rubrivivax sp.]|nr:ribosome silencing factor [Rubrivivax sp.]